MIERISVSTESRTQMVDVTAEIQKAVTQAKITDGMVTVYCPHTTAAVTVNENCDESVQRDINETLSKIIPHHGGYAHAEGNADAHIKSALMGSSRTLLIEKGRIKLGSWQGVFLCEFDGPRDREIWFRFL